MKKSNNMTGKENRSAHIAPSTSSEKLLREQAEEIARGKAIMLPEKIDTHSSEEDRLALLDGF
jgi:hypothetical protein